MNIKLKIINNHDLSEQEVREELLLAEIRMNTQSKLRFHIEEITEDEGNIITDTYKYCSPI